MTSFDAAIAENEQITAGNLFRTSREGWNAMMNFTVRPPAGLVRIPGGIRANLRYSSMQNLICLRSAGAATCRPYVDSRQQQGQLTLDTDFPPNLSAGLQMAYLLNDERQASRKNSQLVITAFVNLTTSVGQLQ
jgi:hypothetical protein